MVKTKYFIIGTSHAGLSAAEEIRVNDHKGSLTMVTMEDILPYSPTVLPYVISRKVSPDQVALQDLAYFKKNKIKFVRGKAVSLVDPKASEVTLSDGQRIGYERLLIATGSEPTIPPVENLPSVPFLTLRTMADALKHLEVLQKAKTATVMGAGLVGMETAENFTQMGIRVHMVEKYPRILPEYFDEDCSRIIQHVFESRGVHFYLHNYVTEVAYKKNVFLLTLHDGQQLSTDLVVVCTGMKPRLDILSNSDLKLDEGILVDRKMKTSVDNIWAAGDVAQADDFFSQSRILNAILPDAVIQGKIAGANMSGGRLDSDYMGGIPMNTFNFFGNRVFSVGINNPDNTTEYIVNKTVLPAANFYQKMIFKGDVLVGMSAMNSDLDPGIIVNLINRRVNLQEVQVEFVCNPVNVSRRLMWNFWR